MRDQDALLARLGRAQRTCGAVGAVAAALCVVGALVSTEQFLQSYLFAFVLWMGLSLGCMALMMLHHMIRSRWGLPIIRFLEAGARNLGLMAILSIPILLGLHFLYPWAQPAIVAHNEVLQHKQPYLNVPFFWIRTIVYFVIWITFTSVLRRSSLRQDETGDPSLTESRASVGAPGMVVYFLTVTFALTDWVMSLHPSWYSTIYGFWFVVGQGMSATCLAIVLLALFSQYRPYADYATPGQFRDLGNVLLTFVMFWGYLSLSQFLIIYSGNLPDEITYYMDRLQGFWWGLGTFLVLFQFFVPFVLLLSGRTKRTPGYLATLAALLFVVRVLDVFWVVLPFFPVPRQVVTFGYAWMSAASFVGIGGIWLAVFFGTLRSCRLVPAGASRVEEALEHA